MGNGPAYLHAESHLRDELAALHERLRQAVPEQAPLLATVFAEFAGELDGQAAAGEGEARFRALLEAAPDAIVITGQDGRIQLVNRQAETLFGYGRAELVGERTYGTGTVVSTFELEGGAALALGTAFWKTPDGDLAWKVGLEPDVVIRQSEQADIIDITDGETLTPAQLSAATDDQLRKAITMLRSEVAGAG